MRKLGAKGSKVLKIFHILFAVMWIGGGLGVVTVLFMTNPTTGDELYLRSLIVEIIDDYILIPGAIATLLIGVVYGIWTNWGFFKHNWLIVKWILTVFQILFGTFALGPWINKAVELSRELGDSVIENVAFWNYVELAKVFGAMQVLILLSYIVISVLKPWREKRPGKKVKQKVEREATE